MKHRIFVPITSFNTLLTKFFCQVLQQSISKTAKSWVQSLAICMVLTASGWAESKLFSASDVIDALKIHLQDKISFSGDFNIHLTTRKIAIPHEHDHDILTLEEIQFSPNQKNFQAIMAIANGDKKTRLKVISGKIDPLSDVPTLAQAITPGDIIEESDISWQKLPTSRLSQNFILKQDDLIGKTAKNRILQPGQPVNRFDVRAPIVIKRGDSVTVAYRTENMILTTTAIAEKDVATGEMARFKTTNNNKVIHARVIGPQKAEIKPVEF